MNRKQFNNSLFIGAFALMTLGFGACSKDKDPEPEVPKTEEEIQAELKEELRTTMKYNSNYKYLLYSSMDNPDFKSAADFSETLKSTQLDNTGSKYMAPNLVIDKKGVLWFSISGTFYYFEKYMIKKENDVISIKCEQNDMFQISQAGTPTQPTGMGYSLTANYNLKTGKTSQILEAIVNESIMMMIAHVWIQDKNIANPTKSPVGIDPNDYIDL